MSNDLTNPGGSNPFEVYGQAMSSTEGELVKYSKYGEWRAGKDGVKLELGTRFVAEIQNLEVGWRLWEDGKPIGSVMGLVRDGFAAPRRSDLDRLDEAEWPVGKDGKARDPWQFTNVLPLVHPDTGQVYSYQPSSRGGIETIANLSKKYGRHIRAHPSELPVVALDSSSYDHPQYGEIRTPVLRFVEWLKPEITPAVTDMRDDDIPY